MDTHNPGFIQDDVDLNSLLSTSTGWSDQFTYHQQTSVQDPFTRYTTNPQYDQQQFDHLSHQTSYNPVPVPYTNNPSYSSQFQHARPSDVFGSNSFNLEASLQDPNSYHGVQNSFHFQSTGAQHPTISPQNLQYSILPQQQLSNGIASSNFQRPTSGAGNRSDYNFNHRPQNNQNLYFNHPQNGAVQQKAMEEAAKNNPQHSSGLVEIPAKQNVKKYSEDSSSLSSASTAAPTTTAPSRVAVVEIPQMKRPNPLRITHPDLMAKNTSLRPRLEYAPYVVWEDTPIEVTPGLKSTIPKYHPRKSRSGLELVPGLPKSELPTTTTARISKKIRVPKEKTKHVSNYKGTGRSAFDKVSALRADGSSTPIKSPTSTESSSSEEVTSSEDESDYEDEDDMPPPVDISTVREITRPSDIPNAARWDAIGIIWKDPNSSPSAEAIRTAIDDYANAIINLRTQIKELATKIDDATKTKAGEAQIQKLRDSRTERLDALYETIEAANKLGYASIVENLGSHQRLVNGLTTTLIDCAKADDYQGKLPKAVFALLAKFQTLTDELLKKLKFEALQKRWNKRGDQETKSNIATIVSNTTDAKERAAKGEKAPAGADEKKKTLEKIEQSKIRNAENVKSTATNPAKRPHDGDGSNGKPTKKPALDLSSIKIPKRSTNVLANNLLGISSRPTLKAVPQPNPPPKKKEPSPPPTESKLGALLASIAKPPEPPKKKAAPAPGPPETPEEKRRRERKESRRHLRVKFKEGEELEEIRLFKHEQAEDEGRQDNMLRDAHDDRSEGMMHKQRVLEAMDEDEETLLATINDRPYPSDLIKVDFSVLNKNSPFGSIYVTRGGDLQFTTPEQQTQERREALELLVVYNDPSEIPSTAKEPPATSDGVVAETKQLKSPTTPWLIQRLHEIQQLGPEYARHLFINRPEEKKTREDHTRGSYPFSSTSNDVSSVLQQLNGAPKMQQPQLPPVLSAMEQAAWNNLSRIVQPLKGKPYPAIEPPDWMNDTQRKDWWDGFNRDKAVKDKERADQQLMAQIQAPQASQTQPVPPPPTMVQNPMQVPQLQNYQPQMTNASMNYNPAPPTQNQTQGSSADVNQQVVNFLAGWNINGGNGDNYNGYEVAKAREQQQQQQQTQAQHPQAQFDFSAWSNVPGLQQYAQVVGQGQGRWHVGGGMRNEENGGGNGNGGGRQKDQYESNGGKKHRPWKDGSGPLDANGQYKGKKRPCKYWKEGKCAKGSGCTYLHEA